MTEYDLEEDAMLTKVSRYDLYRGEGGERLFIDIHQILSGEKKGMYFASPNLMLKHAKSQYITSADTEEEALKRCLKSIKGVRTEEILKDFADDETPSQ